MGKKKGESGDGKASGGGRGGISKGLARYNKAVKSGKVAPHSKGGAGKSKGSPGAKLPSDPF